MSVTRSSRERLAGPQAQLAHQRPDQLEPAHDAVVGQVGMDAPVAVGAVGRSSRRRVVADSGLFRQS
jgi:hypothetical protein